MKLGDKVKFVYMGTPKTGSIIEVFKHTLSGQVHQSVKIKADHFAMPVTVNITLFPQWVWLIEEKDE